MSTIIYINIPFFSPQSQGQLNTEEITLYLLENLYESELYNMNTQIYYIYIGTGCDGIREHNFNELLKQRPYYSIMHSLKTYPEINEKDTTKIMTILYEHMIDHYSCYWNVLFINLYEIISIYSSSSIYLLSLPNVPKADKNKYDLNDPYDALYNLTKKYTILSNISSFLTTYIDKPVKNPPITNMSILQKNWMDYLIYFYITNYNILISELRTSNVVGIDLQKTPILQYSANIWWSTSNYIHTLIYHYGVCTESVFNGSIGGLYRSVWNSKINWTTDGNATDYNYDIYRNAVSPNNYINAKTINGNDYVYYDFNFKKPSNTPYYYEIVTDENNGKSILEIDDVSLKSGYFFKTNGCFLPIVKKTVNKPQNRLLFGFSNDVQYGKPFVNLNNIKIKKEVENEKIQTAKSTYMTRKELSYIHPQISACDYRKRLLIWNKPKPKPKPTPIERSFDIEQKTRSLINENQIIITGQNEKEKQGMKTKMKMFF